MVTSHWKSWFYGYFPPGKLVSGLLPAWGEGGLFVYSPLGERVCCMVTSRWGSWFLVTSLWGSWIQGYSQLGERVGCISTPRWGSGSSLVPTCPKNRKNRGFL